MSAAEDLLAGAIDYAGMFPPAGLNLETTVRNYEAYRGGRNAWALGRLILPASALAEFVDRWPALAREWPLSVLLSGDFAAEIERAAGLGLRLDVVECRAAGVEQVAELRRLLPEATIFVEAAVGDELDTWLAAIAGAGACAKIRMGGVVSGAIPPATAVAEFLAACARRGVRLKATAGLHHAIRAAQALTYEQGSERAMMHGFVNFFVACAIVCSGGDASEAEAALADGLAADFRCDERQLQWRGWSFTGDRIRQMRESFAVGFGSCSFVEPLEDLRVMGWVR
ncbi:MAG TPA: hypothetical protein VHY48_13185 [Acidobacteriaceae bacterium]|jgi:hypothetical protein|nr:hypothetical protein [Acidobacteriaceae bacterium]